MSAYELQTALMVTVEFSKIFHTRQGRSWLRHYATSLKVAGSSTDEVDVFQFT
jgi:hypothetical protein